MSKELPSCSGCELEYECVNMICFYELLEKEKQKIISDAIYQAKNIIQNYHAYIDADVMESIFRDLEKVKEQTNG